MRKRKKRKGQQGRREEVSERRSRRRDNGNLAKDRLHNFHSPYPTLTDTSSSSPSRPESFAAATPRPDRIVCKHPFSSPSYNTPPSAPFTSAVVCKSNVLFRRQVCVLRPERSTVGSARWTPGLIQHPVCRRQALTRLSGGQTGNGSLGLATLPHTAWDERRGCHQRLLSSPLLTKHGKTERS